MAEKLASRVVTFANVLITANLTFSEQDLNSDVYFLSARICSVVLSLFV